MCKQTMEGAGMIPGVNIISGNAYVVSINRAGGSRGCSEPLNRRFRGKKPLRKFLCSTEHLDCTKIDLNAAKIITVYDYKHTKN